MDPEHIFYLAEGIATLVSLVFTIAIFIHSFYGRFKTFSHAPVEIQEYLSTLRQGLYEERQHMRRIRKRRLPQAYDEGPQGDLGGDAENGGVPFVYSHPQGERGISNRHPVARDKDTDGGKMYKGQAGSPMSVVRSAVKTLIREFKVEERPFLKLTPVRGKEEDLEWSYDISGTREYYKTDIKHRFLWMTHKSDIIEISDRLIRLQQRRISVEATESYLTLADNEIMIRGIGDQLKHIEHMLVELSRAQGRQ